MTLLYFKKARGEWHNNIVKREMIKRSSKMLPEASLPESNLRGEEFGLLTGQTTAFKRFKR
ncbi:hypothetical protein COO91_09944 (plasmid) [Nostoc flagelliforme CCNUN1]|uniref:Uncharacterized protein n=2 Tax=Nostoc flagelliforme CCNUN1 TaxID=2038116 RepID=A0A2K8T7T4_9NOSO|nr:hypothetical protein [Nostoc flagelliforme]AUB43754.1 hypothetical protein COO91_09944 [Nostoc flagelliforme CCNUN1]